MHSAHYDRVHTLGISCLHGMTEQIDDRCEPPNDGTGRYSHRGCGLNYPAQCFDCGSLLGDKLDSIEPEKKDTQKTGDWRDYLSEARDLIKDSEE